MRTSELQPFGWDTLPEPLRHDTFLQVMKELWVVREHHRPLVLVTHGFIEMATDALIKHHVKNAKRILHDSRTYPHSAKLLILNELGVVSDANYALLDSLRKLRNRAAHEPLFELHENDFRTVRLADANGPIEDFHMYCILLLGRFWNAHLPILGPLFAPGAMGIEEKAKRKDLTNGSKDN